MGVLKSPTLVRCAEICFRPRSNADDWNVSTYSLEVMTTMASYCDRSLPLLQLSATNSMHAELIEDDGESRYKVTDIIGKPYVAR